LWAERGKYFKERIQAWKEEGSVWNFEHKFFLIAAEEAYSRGEFENAKILYEKAATSARQHKFLHEEAIALELAGNFHIQTGDKTTALKYFIEAHQRYYEWQAYAKEEALGAFIKEKFGDAQVSTAGKATDSMRNVTNSSPFQEERVGT
jgi:tetratricopeptide (TPR) repeat protein